jgi:glucose/arabinose dehydrogenase
VLSLRIDSPVTASPITAFHSVLGSVDLHGDLDAGPGQLYQPLVFKDPSGNSVGGTLTIHVTAPSGNTDIYGIQALVNAQCDLGDSGLAISQSLAVSTIDVDPGSRVVSRAAASGSVERPVNRILTETEGFTNDLRGSWDQSPDSTWKINSGTGVTGSLNGTRTRTYDPIDTFSFCGHAGDRISIRTSGIARALGLQDPKGGQTTGTTLIDLVLPHTGNYEISVSTSDGLKGTYTLTADLTTADPRPNTVDLYSITANDGEYLSLSLAATEGYVNGALPKVQCALYLPGVDAITGSPVAVSDIRGSLDGRIECLAVASGTYTVKVTAGSALLFPSAKYNLVAVTNGSLEINGVNTTFASAQDMTNRAGVIGSIGTSTVTFVPTRSGGLSRAIGVDFSADDKYMFVSSFNSDQVMRYDAKTGAPKGLTKKSNDAVFVKAGLGGLDSPEYLRVGPDGNLYVVSSSTNQVFRYNATTGAFMDIFVKASANGGLNHPVGLTFGPDANQDSVRDLYVGGDRSVMVYSGLTGGFVREFVVSGRGGLILPEGMSFGPDGNLYVSSGGTDQILRYDGATGQFMGTFVGEGSGGLHEPTGLAFGPDDSLYVSSRMSNAILRFGGPESASAGAFLCADVISGAEGLERPGDLAFGPDGLYFSGEDQSIVYRTSLADDFYRIDLQAGKTYAFSTATPGDGPGQPVNVLDPHIELYNTSNALVATGALLVDGRNEQMDFTPATSGTYYVKVSGDRGLLGEYFLDCVAETTAMARSAAVYPSSEEHGQRLAIAAWAQWRMSAADAIFSEFGHANHRNDGHYLAVDLTEGE